MKRNFFSTVPQVFCALIACVALTGRLTAATADEKLPVKSSGDKDHAKSLVERVAEASKVLC
jgi:hypothetical protein